MRQRIERFPGGKLPAQPARPQLRFGNYARSLPAPADMRDWLLDVSDWPMYLNDTIGDCTAAEVGHQIEQFSTYGQGAVVEIADDDVLSLYEATGGYVPGQPDTDQGAYVQDVLKYWRKEGVAGHRIAAYASLDVGNLTQVRQAIELFGSVDVGFSFPSSAMAQFNAGEPWDVVPGSAVQGGHCVMVGGYTPGLLSCVTWGAVQPLTEAFWRAYVDEAWVIITREWVNGATQHTPQGLDAATLGLDFAALTGQANPFADVPPTDPDAQLWHSTGAWARGFHPCSRKVAAALRAWGTAKGF
jgi:hypothetical protein